MEPGGIEQQPQKPKPSEIRHGEHTRASEARPPSEVPTQREETPREINAARKKLAEISEGANAAEVLSFEQIREAAEAELEDPRPERVGDGREQKAWDSKAYERLPVMDADVLPQNFGFAAAEVAHKAYAAHAVYDPITEKGDIIETLDSMAAANQALVALTIGPYNHDRGTTRAGYTVCGDLEVALESIQRAGQNRQLVVVALPVGEMVELARKKVIALRKDGPIGEELVVSPSLDTAKQKRFRESITVGRFPEETETQTDFSKKVMAKTIPVPKGA